MTETVSKADPIPAPAQPAGDAGASLSQETVGAVAVLTMHHAPHNLLGEQMVADLFAALDWVRQIGARAVLLRSSLRHFSAGAEMAAFESHKEGRMHSLPLVELLRAFDELPIPVVAAVNGVCVGGGFELALACDFVIAGEVEREDRLCRGHAGPLPADGRDPAGRPAGGRGAGQGNGDARPALRRPHPGALEHHQPGRA